MKFLSFFKEIILIKNSLIKANETLKTDMLDTSQYVINPKLEASRFNVIPVEFIQDNAAVLRITFTIKDLRLTDNGLYRCTYNHSYKDIKLEVYSKF